MKTRRAASPVRYFGRGCLTLSPILYPRPPRQSLLDRRPPSAKALAISIPPMVVAELRKYRSEQQLRWLALGRGRVKDDDLILSTWHGEMRSPVALSKDWGTTVKSVTLHALRHTHASQLIAAGMDVISISRRLGHSKPSVTLNVYGHLFGTNDDRAASIMQAAFTRTEATGNSETLREQFVKTISKDRQFQEAKKSGKAFVIGGAKPSA